MGKWSAEARAKGALKAVRRQPTADLPETAKRFQEARDRSGLTLADIHRIAGVSASQIHYYETGQREPNLSTARALAKAYRVSLDWLAGEQR